MTNREKFKEVFGKDIKWSEAIEPQMLALKSAQINGIDCMEEWLNAEYKEPTTKNDLGVDCVSRQFMYDLGATCIATRNENGKLIALGTIEELPPVTPQEPFDNRPCISSGVCEHDKQKVLEKVRAEIAEYGSIMVAYAITKDTKTDKGIQKLVSGVLKQAKDQVLNIIDKHMESEVEDGECK